MNAVCKMTGEATTWPCSAHGCPLYGDCLSEYTGNSKPMTNADRIRAMSDEELAIWLAEWSFCADACPASTNEVEEAIGYCCPSNCKEQALTWLQQPAEEET